MSSTAVQEDTPHTITLTNGNSFTFNSNASTTDEAIPVIDVSRIYSDKLEDRQAVAEEIREAAHGIGFLSIVNHVSPGLCDSPINVEGRGMLIASFSPGHRHATRSERHGPSKILLCSSSREEIGSVHRTDSG